MSSNISEQLLPLNNNLKPHSAVLCHSLGVCFGTDLAGCGLIQSLQAAMVGKAQASPQQLWVGAFEMLGGK